MTDEFWNDFFSFHLGPWGLYLGPSRPFRISYHRTSDSHILRLKINPEVKKEEIKARFVKPGVLEIEWPRKIKGEKIPIE
ncbi:hypothetical protein J7L33_03850 [Candidatus Bathyarchaeota archaeon]|nr:hypothetical protein [Candidatus Bathyarchaeota archaeon]